MTEDQFKNIFQRIEAAWGQEYNDQQFAEWLDSFGEENYEVAVRAFRLMKDEYKYPPAIATFQAYIQRIKEKDEAMAESFQAKESTRISPEDMDRHKRWARFYSWCRHIGRWPKPNENAIKLKENFEKEHPDWEPPEKKKIQRKMKRIGDILNEGEILRG